MKLAILALFLVLMAASVVAAPPIVTLESPADNYWSQTLQSMTYFPVAERQITSCSLVVDGIVNQTDTTIAVNESQSFILTTENEQIEWQISCLQDNAEVGISETRTITFDTEVPEVELIGPETGSVFNTTSVFFSYKPEDENLDECTLRANFTGSMQDHETDNSPTSGVTNNFAFILGDGSYVWNVECSDQAGNVADAPQSNALRIDTTAPQVENIKPSGTVTAKNANFVINTNERAHCKFSTNDVTFESMSDFTITNQHEHTHTLSGLDDGTYTYYYSCRDQLGNTLTTTEHQFIVRLLPTAEIELGDPSPIRAGKIDVYVTTSRDMQSAPSLTYRLDGDTSSIAVPLSGEGTEWSGIMIIPKYENVRIGTYSFSGTDLNGLLGEEITDGKVFVIDTVAPTPPSPLKAISEDNGWVTLTWHSTSEDATSFNIYRSTSTEPSYLDYYSSTNDSKYIDDDANDKVTYYYRVAGVDESGNVGELSEFVFATAINEKTEPEVKEEETVEGQVLPPPLIPQVDAAIGQVTTLILSIEAAIEEQASDTRTQVVYDSIGIETQLNGAKAKAEQLKTNLEKQKERYATEEELTSFIDDIMQDVLDIQATTPSQIEILEESSFFQTASEETVESTSHLIGSETLTEKQLRQYQKLNNAFREVVETKTLVHAVRVTYLDSSSTEKTYITKEISAGGEEFSDITIVEHIPKSVAATADDLSYIGKQPVVIENDPVVSWGFFDFPGQGVTLDYHVDRRISTETLRESQTVVLKSLAEVDVAVEATGFSIVELPSFGDASSMFLWIGIATIAILSSYYAVFVRNDGQPIENIKNFLPRQSSRGDVSYRRTAGTLLRPKSDALDVLNELDSELTAIKSGLAKQLSPLIGRSSKRLEAKQQLETMTMLIEEIQDHLDNDRLYAAKMLYPELNTFYKQLHPEDKKQVIQACQTLHSRLLRK